MPEIGAEIGRSRGLSLGAVIERAVAVVRQAPAAVFGSAFLLSVLPRKGFDLLAEFVPARLSGWGNGPVRDAITPAIIAMAFGALLAGWVLSAVVQGAIVRVALGHEAGERVGLGTSLRTGLCFALPLMAVSLVSGVAALLGAMFFIVPGVIIYLMWSIVAPALVAERCGVFGALSRSQDLTAGARLPILGLLLLLGVAEWFVDSVGTMASPAFAYDNTVARIGLDLVYAVLSAVQIGVGGAVTAALFIELRLRREGAGEGRLQTIFA